MNHWFISWLYNKDLGFSSGLADQISFSVLLKKIFQKHPGPKKFNVGRARTRKTNSNKNNIKEKNVITKSD